MAEMEFFDYEYIPVIDSSISGTVEGDSFTLDICIPQTDLSKGVVIKLIDPVTGEYLLKDELTYKEKLEENVKVMSGAQSRFSITISNDDLIEPIAAGRSYQVQVRMSQLAPMEEICDHDFGQWVPSKEEINGEPQHERICFKCGEKELASCVYPDYWLYRDDDSHSKVCDICYGNEKIESHDHEFGLDDKYTHSKVCSICYFLIMQKHKFTYETIEGNNKQHKCICEICQNIVRDENGEPQGEVVTLLEQHYNNNPHEDSLCDACGAYWSVQSPVYSITADGQLYSIQTRGTTKLIIPKEVELNGVKVEVKSIGGLTKDTTVLEDVEAEAIESIEFEDDSKCEILLSKAFANIKSSSIITVDLPSSIKILEHNVFSTEWIGTDIQSPSYYYFGTAKQFEAILDNEKSSETWFTDKSEATIGPVIECYSEPTDQNELKIEYNATYTEATIVSGINFTGTELVIPAEVESLSGIKVPVTKIGKNAFNTNFIKNSTIKTVDIPRTVTVIEKSAFEGQTFLTTIITHKKNKLVEIEENAFNNCGFETVDLSLCTSLVKLQNYAFGNCKNLQQLTLPASIQDFSALSIVNHKAEFNIEIPDSELFFKDNAGNVFKKPDILILAATKKGDKTYDLSGCSAIGPGAFANTAIQYLRVPTNVSAIGQGAFYNCTNLTWISLPNTLVSLEAELFKNCKSLRFVTGLTVNIQEVKADIFFGCSDVIVTYNSFKKYWHYKYDKTNYPNGTTKDEKWDNGAENLHFVYKYEAYSAYPEKYFSILLRYP